MTGSNKSYTAPRLESLSLRETRDININVNGPSGSHVDVSAGLGSLVS